MKTQSGEWSILWDVFCVCSECKGKQIKFSNYCPDCGAKMKTPKNEFEQLDFPNSNKQTEDGSDPFDE